MSDLLEEVRASLKAAHREVRDIESGHTPADVKVARYGAVIQSIGKAIGMTRVDSKQRSCSEHATFEKFAVDLLRYILIQVYWIYEHTKMAYVPPKEEERSAAITHHHEDMVSHAVAEAHRSIDEAWEAYNRK
jgi:hypothetical protein